MATIRQDTLLPEYLKNFQCIGASCEDTCCAGWKVTIDEETFKKYKRVTDYEMKRRLDQSITRQRSNANEANAAKMKLKKNNTCSFLNEEGWCDIHSTLGEDYLCNTCAIYPRITNQVNGLVERTLTVSCPEAARLVLLNPDGIGFEQGTEERSTRNAIHKMINMEKEKLTCWEDFFAEIRYVTTAILQCRNYSLEERLMMSGLLYNELEEVKKDDIQSIPNVLGEYLNVLETGALKGQFDSITARKDLQLKLGRELILLRLKTAISSERYLECSRDMMEGLKLDSSMSDSELENVYIDAYDHHYAPFMAEHDYMLENYLVNYVFKNCMPVDQVSPFESYTRLILHYALIKLHLIGIAAKYEGLTDDLVVKLVQSMSKTFEHNSEYFEKIMKLMKENDMLTMENMTIFIKD